MPATATPDGGNLYDRAMLRSWREEAGLTREAVCHATGISYPWLTRLETRPGDKSPSLALLHQLADYYGRDVAELFPVALREAQS